MTTDVGGSSVACCAHRNAMIVEEDLRVRGQLESCLREIGFEVIAQTGDVNAALAAYRERRPDLVLVDVTADGADGTELVKELLTRIFHAFA